MISKKDIVAILLAGGKSTRMRKDKALLDYEGSSFLAHLVKVSKSIAASTLISSNNVMHQLEGVSRIKDLKENCGPLMGLYSCMSSLDANYFLVLSCDSPLISVELIDYLVNNHEENYDMTMLKSEDHAYPLIAIYNKNCQVSLATYLESNKRSVFGFLEKLKVQSIEVPPQFQSQIRNFNRPEDLKFLEKHV